MSELLPVPLRRTASRTVFQSPWLTVREDEVASAGGHHRYAVVSRKPFVVVLALVGADALLLVRQYRYAVGRWLWELPQGGVEPGEDPVDTAGRETAEETGWELAEPAVLADGLPEAGDWATHTFSIVTGRAAARLPGGARPDRTESSLSAHVVPTDRLREMAGAGEIVDPPTLSALCLWQLRSRPAPGRGTGGGPCPWW